MAFTAPVTRFSGRREVTSSMQDCNNLRTGSQSLLVASIAAMHCNKVLRRVSLTAARKAAFEFVRMCFGNLFDGPCWSTHFFASVLIRYATLCAEGAWLARLHFFPPFFGAFPF